MAQRFEARIVRGTTKNTMGLVVPPEIVAALGRGKRPPVTVTIGDYSYRSTVASMGGEFLVGVSAAHRASLHIDDRETVDVTLEIDDAPRDTPVPHDMAAALAQAGAREAFDRLAPSRRRELVREVEDAKTQATRDRRIAKVVEPLRSGA